MFPRASVFSMFRRVISSVEGGISSSSLLANGLFATGHSDGSIKVWNRKSKRNTHVLKKHQNAVSSLCPFDQGFLSASYDGTIIIWQEGSYRVLGQLTGHKKSVTSLISTYGFIVSGSADSTIKVWDPYTKKCIDTLFCMGKVFDVQALSPSTLLSVDGNADGTMDRYNLTIWDVKTSSILQSTTTTGHINGIAHLKDGRIMTVGGDELTLWDAKSLAKIGAISMPKTEGACLDCVQIDESQIAVTSGFSIFIVNLISGSISRLPPSHKNHVLTLALNENQLITCSEDGVIQELQIANCFPHPFPLLF